MATPVIMPKQGQSVETCIITSWLKKKGEVVHKKYNAPKQNEDDNKESPFDNGFWYCDLLLEQKTI